MKKQKRYKLAAGMGLISMVLSCVVGCGQNSPDQSENMKDDRHGGTYTLIFREFQSSLYKVEYGGRTYIMNTEGGVTEITE